MIDTYVKLATSFLESSLWFESHSIRLVWITMLLKSDSHGEVSGSALSLAHAARVTVDEAVEALALLLAPDPNSRTPTAEGRRIEAIEGGWQIINHQKYRDRASLADRKRLNAERQRRFRARNPARYPRAPKGAVTPPSADPVTRAAHAAHLIDGLTTAVSAAADRKRRGKTARAALGGAHAPAAVAQALDTRARRAAYLAEGLTPDAVEAIFEAEAQGLA